MEPVEVIRVRSDLLARQVYEFGFNEPTCELYLQSYQYQERLSKRKRWAICQQWRRDVADMFTGGISLDAIPLDQPIIDAAVEKFKKQVTVVKEVTGETVQGLSEMVRTIVHKEKERSKAG